ncbi:hypothetical protein [Haloglycomyces albus]|uniref:hypothetical protein n=1 Tax=Haloglycomyces albus TaxID=526067 RepID=UPI00046C9F5F|nr:hypothetical protein [Haloglycomyces albus]
MSGKHADDAPGIPAASSSEGEKSPTGENGSDGHTVSLSEGQVREIAQLVRSGKAASVDDYVLRAVEDRLERDRSLTQLQELFDRKGHGPSAEHLAWAREVLGVEREQGEEPT